MTDLYLNEAEQKIIGQAKIGLAGCGGLGSNAAEHLVRSGVVRLTAADFDIVNHSNLNRQNFTLNQVGMAKVDALKVNLLAINPELELDFKKLRLDRSNALEFFQDCDVVIEAFDDANCKMELIKNLTAAGKTVVGASGIAGWGNSNALKVRKIGDCLYIVGDFETEICDMYAPHSARVGIAAAMQANTVMALLLNKLI